MLDNYKIVTVPTNFAKPFDEFSKEEAKEYLNWFLNKKEERKVLLQDIAKDYFIPDYSIESLKGVYYFMKDNVSYRVRSVHEVNRLNSEINMKGVEVSQKDLSETTVSICFDIGVYFGEVLIKNNSQLQWTYCIAPRRHVDYGQPVIKGNTKMDLNPRRIFEVIASKFVNYKSMPEDQIVELYDIWLESLCK